MNALRTLSDEALLSELDVLVTSERRTLVRFLHYLSEVEDRRLHLEAAYSSLFDFCTRKFKMSEGAAFRRLTAARLLRRFPVIAEFLERGDAHLSGLVLLRDHLTEDGHADLLREAAGKSKKEIAQIIAARAPKPDVPGAIRKLPVRPTEALGVERSKAPPPASRRPAPVEPLSAARYKVQFTANESLRDKLERARRLLSHANPSLDLAVVVERAVDLLLADVEKKKLAKLQRPGRGAHATERSGSKASRSPTERSGSKASSSPKASSTITRATRREVFARDGERCSFVSQDGLRCDAQAFLELDHAEPRAVGGSGEATNVRVLCRAHNRLGAERIFGREHVESKIHLRQRKCADGIYENLQSALERCGFRRGLVRKVLDAMQAGQANVPWSAPVEQLLREAISLLTASA